MILPYPVKSRRVRYGIGSVVDPDPELFAGSESLIWYSFRIRIRKAPIFGDKGSMKSAEPPLVTDNFTIRTQKFTVKTLKSLL